MEDHREILKRVGLALTVFGLVDIAFMIYSLAQGQSYSSTFNIFAVLAGIFLMRGSLGAARLVTWFSAFMLASFAGAVLLLFPFMQPLDLLIAQAKIYPARLVTPWLVAAAAFVLLGWIYARLRSPPVIAALLASGRSATAPRHAFVLGVGFVVFLAAMLKMTLHGTANEKAIELARHQLGPGYNYATQSIQWGGGHGRAVVAAYNDEEIQHVTVEW